MYTTERYGGVTLGAFVQGRLVGYSYALPGFDGRPFLLSCGLAVARGFESRGIGASLKLAQADHARRVGYRTIRWTTNSLASGPLRLYLSKLGARMVRYHEEMYAPVHQHFFPDEVEIEWDLRRAAAANPVPGHASPLTRSREVGAGLRQLTSVDRSELRSLSASRYCVEIPWDRRLLQRRRPDLRTEWLQGVRATMRPLLAHGYVGTAVLADRSSRRSFVTFDQIE
jgi:predicted GNAT superfamily acetyltransferase